jgi:hypothetical protein
MSDIQDKPVFAFAGRVLLAFGSLIVLGALVVAMVGLAYWSKYQLQTGPHGAPAANQAAAAPAP